MCWRGKKGTEWWMQEMKTVVEQKRKLYKKMLQRNVLEEGREQWRRECRESKVLVKRLVRDNEERIMKVLVGTDQQST